VKSSLRHLARALALAAAGSLAAGAAHSAVIVVNSSSDAAANDGKCTLREAIVAANTNTASGAMPGECAKGDAGADVIHFSIPGGGVHTIQPSSALPSITEPLTIDGYSQPGTSPNTLAVGNDAVLSIEIDGTNAGPILTGLIDVQAGPSTIRGLVVNRAQAGNSAGISIGADGSHIEGNFIGTDPSGTSARSNQCNGLRINSSNNTIGGATPAARNVISATSGCGINLILSGDGNHVQGNYIGTDAAGNVAMSDLGIDVNGSGNVIGGAGAGEGNVISGNGTVAFRISGIDVSGNLLQGNKIGTNATATGPVPNGTGIDFFSGAHDNTIGGDSVAAGNVIAFNNGKGVTLEDSAGSGNRISFNSIYSNGALGIDLGDDGVTLNDDKDPDTGPNDLQNFPVLTSVGQSSVQWTFNSTPNTQFTLQFFASPTCDPSGYGEGKTPLQTAVTTTDANGDSSGGTSLTVPPGTSVTATATSPSGSTSEFSQCVLTPVALAVDPAAGATSDGNGVFEPGETVSVEPTWANYAASSVMAGGTASAFGGPAGGTYTLVDDTASYGTIAAGTSKSCSATPDCYAMSVSGARPGVHWDATFLETLDVPGTRKTWTLHLGDSFSDVPRSELFYRKIETLLHHGVTVGCNGSQYCPAQKVPRSQMAIFIARSLSPGAPLPASGSANGSPYDCKAGGVSAFTDVAPTDAFCRAVHFVAAQNVTSGCGPSVFCPDDLVSRAQMAIFVAKGVFAPAGGGAIAQTYGPDPVTGRSYSCAPGTPNLHFSDVLVSDSFCKHAHYLWATGVISGCSATQYCPAGDVARDEMAKFLSNAFRLALYGP